MEQKMLNDWFAKQPKWLQKAVLLLHTKSELTDDDVLELARTCYSEAANTLEIIDQSFDFSHISQTNTTSLRLTSIRNIQGINALSSNITLSFQGDNNLTLVYGPNGSGKSSYVRLLKHICQSREAGTLYNNIFEQNSTEQKAVIYFVQDNEDYYHDWQPENQYDLFNFINIFDSSIAKHFIVKENEVSYESPILNFFSSLISICSKVTNILQSNLEKNQTKKIVCPVDFYQTPEFNWINSINYQSKLNDFDLFCSFDVTHEQEIQKLEQELAVQDPLVFVKQLTTQKQYIEQIIQCSNRLLTQLSDHNYQAILTAKQTVSITRLAAKEAADKVFSNQELDGIGTDTWKELWEAARKYSTSFAYKNTNFPNTENDALCVLCLQKLSPDAQQRFASFEDYVKGSLHQKADKAYRQYLELYNRIEKIPSRKEIETLLDAANYTDNIIINKMFNFFDILNERKIQLNDINFLYKPDYSLTEPSW
ncbi:MAG: hypothetical protein LBG48_00460, partial [Rickettsiales bacterium]|nr:hypothetical protein [Rickettsiales bacterium]